MPNTIVEGFVSDQAFIDQRKLINEFLIDETGRVAQLTPKALSYFSSPGVYQDARSPGARVVNWVSNTSPRMIVDEDAFPTFVTVVNALAQPVTTALFKIIDKLFFDCNANTASSVIETYLTTDTDTSTIYTAGSFKQSATILSAPVYLSSGTTQNVSVPAFISFSITLPSGSSTVGYDLTLYASPDAFLVGYNISSVVKVIPALPYDQLYTASIVNARDNIFTTASTSATLAYNTEIPVIGSTSVSGVTEYSAVVTDGVNNVRIPFNILFKGRTPTLPVIRSAIKDALLNSGVGDLSGWQARIPGVFVVGRYYIIPLWDQTVQKPNQLIFPDILDIRTYSQISNKVLISLAYGDVTQYIDTLAIYYNKMLATAVPDLSGTIPVTHLSSFIPDYQSYSPDEADFNYMADQTKQFSTALNTILAIDSGADTSNQYTTTTENLLTFYSFTVQNYEICVISKLCYQTTMEATQ